MRKLFYTKRYLIGIFIFLLISSISVLVYAYGNGRAGCTLKNQTTGCNCHTTTPNTAITVTLTGPDTVLTGSVTTYTFSLTRTGTFSTGGIDIAVSTGTLGIGTSTGIKMLSGEVVHSAKFTGATTKTFTFTAPSTPGTITMYATGAAGTNPPNWNNAQNKTIVVKAPTGIENNTTPVTYNLKQNYPNPFNPVTKISYDIAKSSKVSISVYDVLGNKVTSLVNEKQETGSHSVEFNAGNLSSGIYYYKIIAGDFSEVRKMTLIK